MELAHNILVYEQVVRVLRVVFLSEQECDLVTVLVCINLTILLVQGSLLMTVFQNSCSPQCWQMDTNIGMMYI